MQLTIHTRVSKKVSGMKNKYLFIYHEYDHDLNLYLLEIIQRLFNKRQLRRLHKSSNFLFVIFLYISFTIYPTHSRIDRGNLLDSEKRNVLNTSFPTFKAFRLE